MENKNYEICVGQLGKVEPLKKLPTMRDVSSELSMRSEDLLANVRRLRANMFGIAHEIPSDKKEATCLEEELENTLQTISNAQRVIAEIFEMIGI